MKIKKNVRNYSYIIYFMFPTSCLEHFLYPFNEFLVVVGKLFFHLMCYLLL